MNSNNFFFERTSYRDPLQLMSEKPPSHEKEEEVKRMLGENTKMPTITKQEL